HPPTPPLFPYTTLFRSRLRHRAAQFARLEADRHRLLLVAINDRRDASSAPHRPGRALAGALARLGGEAQNLGHRLVTPLSNTSRSEEHTSELSHVAISY